MFQQGKDSAALVFCDLVGISFDVSSAARQKASKATGIRVEHIVVTATHSHTAPLFYGACTITSTNAKPSSMARTAMTAPPIVRSWWIRSLPSSCRRSRLEPVELKSGYATEDRISFNRRYYMKDWIGKVQSADAGSQHHQYGRAHRPTGWNRIANQARGEKAKGGNCFFCHASGYDGRHVVLGRLSQTA